MAIINDGTGDGNDAKVDANNRLHTLSIAESEALHAAEQGDGYNLNTGLVAVSANSALMYIKNNENQDIVVEAVAIGSFEGITHSDDPYITLIRNPSTGTLISGATDVDMKQNRNFGSSKILVADVYKGASGNTVTDGDDIAILQVTPGGRSFYSIDFVLPKGSSLAIELTANISSGSANYYVAIICHLKDTES